MAITGITLSKTIIREKMKDMNVLSIGLICRDGVDVVINKTYEVKLRTGDNIAEKIAQKKKEIQADITGWKNEQATYNDARVDAAVSSLETALKSANGIGA